VVISANLAGPLPLLWTQFQQWQNRSAK